MINWIVSYRLVFQVRRSEGRLFFKAQQRRATLAPKSVLSHYCTPRVKFYLQRTFIFMQAVLWFENRSSESVEISQHSTFRSQHLVWLIPTYSHSVTYQVWHKFP